MESEDILLTVGMLTYNHAGYVRQALDGIVMQKVSFRYEVIVGDDCSTDGTQDILKEYAKKYPKLFRLVLREENIGGTKNNFDLKHRARGKYYACLEGDDYWTDDQKLQIQVDFLEAHPEYIACVHKCVFVDKDRLPLSGQPINGYYSNKEIFTLKDFEKGELPGQTATLMYRNIFLDHTRDFSILYKASDKISDKTAVLILLGYGPIFNIDRVMSCYRYIITPNGTNVSSDYIGENNRDKLMEYLNILEKYAKDEMGISLNMDYKKQNYFVAAVTIWMKNPTDKNKAVMDRMVRLGKKPLRYIFLKYRVMITKWLGWHVLKRDIRININKE